MICKRYSAPTFFLLFESNSLRKIQGSFIFIDINHGFCQPCYSLTIWPKIFRAFCFCASCRSDRVLSMLFNSCLDALAHSVTEMVGFSFLSSNVLKFDKLLLSFKWQQFCNEKARTWFGLYGFPSYPLSSVYFQRSSILRRKKKKNRGRGLSSEWKHRFRWTTIVSFLTMLSPRLSFGELICYGESI